MSREPRRADDDDQQAETAADQRHERTQRNDATGAIPLGIAKLGYILGRG